MFSEPAVGESFFGREEVLDILSKRTLALKDGYRQNIALTGHSLAGKSSIILQFMQSIRHCGFLPIYVEVIKESFRNFAEKFIATMLYNALYIKGEDAGTELGSLLDKASRIFPKTHSAVRGVLSCIENDEPDQAYSGLLELTSVFRQESGTPCVVILDEFDNMDRIGIKNPFVAFGKVIMVQKDTMYIVSSSRALAIRKIISEKLSLLFGNFEILKISNFGIRASGDFICARLGGFDIDEFTRKFLIAFTDGNPFYLNKLLSAMKDMALERMTSHIDFDIVTETILELVYNSSGTIHQYLMNYMLELVDTKCKDLHISVLSSIAEGKRRPQEIARALRVKKASVSDALQRLSEQGLITRSGVFYTLDDAMLDFWLGNVFERKRRLLIDGGFDKASLFRADIGVYAAGFRSAFAMSNAERLAELFNLFSNEMVSLDMKNSKMPHFTKVELKSFADSGTFVAASFRGSFWIAQVYDGSVNENDIVAFIRNVKSLDFKISNRLIIPLKGIEENAKLLAKELKISIWDSRTMNHLMSLYGRKRMVAI